LVRISIEGFGGKRALAIFGNKRNLSGNKRNLLLLNVLFCSAFVHIM
jgi:hypothetical protein